MWTVKNSTEDNLKKTIVSFNQGQNILTLFLHPACVTIEILANFIQAFFFHFIWRCTAIFKVKLQVEKNSDKILCG